MQRTIVIGDVHGCLGELEELLRKVGAGGDDEVILVGDLLSKGPDSQGVVQLAREQGIKAVRGNHDAALLRIRRGELEKPPKPAQQKVADSLKEADWKWLEGRPLYLRARAPQVIVVHGGLVPGVPLEEQQTDHLLNLRSITPEGKPSKKVDEGEPWGSKWTGPEHVAFGHDAVPGLQQYPFATGLDTGCVYGRELTALILPERRLVSVPARKVWSEPHH